jgi:hypothetical protein
MALRAGARFICSDEPAATAARPLRDPTLELPRTAEICESRLIDPFAARNVKAATCARRARVRRTDPASRTFSTRLRRWISALEARGAIAQRARGDEFDRADRDALKAYYAEPGRTPMWVAGGELSRRAKDVMAEIGRAEGWGLSSAVFELLQGQAKPAR